MQQEVHKSDRHREKLVSYLNDLPMPKQKKFATNCGTTIGQMRQIAYGNRPCRANMAISIDKNSRGKVRMEYMAPDVDWAYVLIALNKRNKNEPEKASS